MSTSTWVMLVCHVILFLYLRLKLTIKKKKLEKENSKLRIENLKHTSTLATYEKIINEQYG